MIEFHGATLDEAERVHVFTVGEAVIVEMWPKRGRPVRIHILGPLDRAPDLTVTPPYREGESNG